MPEKTVVQAAIDMYLTALVSSDIDAIIGLYDIEATVEDPVGSEEIQGREAIRAFYSKATSGISEARATGAIRCAGMEVAFPFRVIIDLGKGKRTMEVIDVFRFNAAGKVVSMRAFWSRDNMKPV